MAGSSHSADLLSTRGELVPPPFPWSQTATRSVANKPTARENKAILQSLSLEMAGFFSDPFDRSSRSPDIETPLRYIPDRITDSSSDDRPKSKRNQSDGSNTRNLPKRLNRQAEKAIKKVSKGGKMVCALHLLFPDAIGVVFKNSCMTLGRKSIHGVR
jgi:hypothetical protein